MSDEPEEMMTVGEVCRFLGGAKSPLDKSTVYRWVREGRLPPPVRLGPQSTRWRRSELERVRGKQS